MRLRERLNATLGTGFEVAGRIVGCLPSPTRLLQLRTLSPGLPAERVPRLHAVAQRAIEGRLGCDHIRALGQRAAEAELMTLPGIGPFYSQLISVRASGLDDALPVAEAISRERGAALRGARGQRRRLRRFRRAMATGSGLGGGAHSRGRRQVAGGH